MAVVGALSYEETIFSPIDLDKSKAPTVLGTDPGAQGPRGPGAQDSPALSWRIHYLCLVVALLDMDMPHVSKLWVPS